MDVATIRRLYETRFSSKLSQAKLEEAFDEETSEYCQVSGALPLGASCDGVLVCVCWCFREPGSFS